VGAACCGVNRSAARGGPPGRAGDASRFADRAPVQPGRRPSSQKTAPPIPGNRVRHIVGEPAQDQVQARPASAPTRGRAAPRSLGALAEPGRGSCRTGPAPKCRSGSSSEGRLLRPQAQARGVIQRPVTTRNPARLSRNLRRRWRTPSPQELEETPPAAPATAAAVADAGSQATCRAALNSSSGASPAAPRTRPRSRSPSGAVRNS